MASIRFDGVLRQELDCIEARRRDLWRDNTGADQPAPAVVPAAAAPPLTDEQRLHEQRKRALEMGLVGLALSGGGIRSGTVSIGFLQGLASRRLLGLFDYISSVSGGGYASSWFAAWVKREGSLANVEKQLDPSRVSEASAERFIRDEVTANQNTPFKQVVDPEPEPLYHVRAYANYLTPRPGLFSADAWTLISSYLCNTLVNLLILVPIFTLLVIGVRFIVWLYARGAGQPPWAVILTVAAVGMPVFGLGMVLWYRARLLRAIIAARGEQHGDQPEESGLATRQHERGNVRLLTVFPMVLTAVLGVWAFGIDPTHVMASNPPLRYWQFERINKLLIDLVGSPLAGYAVSFALLATFAGVVGVACNWFIAQRTRVWATMFSNLVLGAFVGCLSFLALSFVVWPLAGAPAVLATIGPPLALVVLVLGGYVEQALFGRFQFDYEREWRSRGAALLLRCAASWLLVFGFTLFLPWAVEELSGSAAKYVTPALITGWVSTVVGALFAARSPKSGAGAGRPSPGLRVLAAAGPVVFLLGVVTLLSLMISGLLGPLAERTIGGGITVGTQFDHLWALIAAACICLLVTITFSLLSDVNLFSMHSVYGNRLTRCFLAASRRKPHEVPTDVGRRRSAPIGIRGGYRRQNRFTGFDPQDDLRLSDLLPVPNPNVIPNTTGRHAWGYTGPYPIFNTALNLIGGDDLALRDTKADSFFLSPGHCGSDATGYAATPVGEPYGERLTLGRAMTISGAAADPNMSLVNSPAQTALLTLLNARLGWWIENPRGADEWTASSPKPHVVSQLVREFLGKTNDAASHVHLSDGGHYDNSGIYELVRRRCRYIVAVDAAEDVNDASENLANAIRKVRTYLGIRIEIDTSPLRKDEKGLSKWHVAVGSVRYDDVDEGALAGLLIFVRSSLTGDEPVDLRQYAVADPAFPHHSTITEQFFNEVQFESYRALGHHLAESVFGGAGVFHVDQLTAKSHGRDVRQYFARLRNRWFPPPPDFNAQYAEAGKLFADLIHDLRCCDGKAKRLVAEMYPEAKMLAQSVAAQNGPIDEANAPDELLAIDHILDVMELAWLGVGLDGYYAHPMNRGWMGIFRRWTSSPTFQKFWPVLRGEYSKDFVRFCEKALNLPPVAVVLRPAAEWDSQTSRYAAVANLARMRDSLRDEFGREWTEILRQLRDRQDEAYFAERERVRTWRRREPDRAPAADPPAPLPVPTDLGQIIDAAVAQAEGGRPLVWFLTLEEPALKDYPIGVIAVRKVERLPDDPILALTEAAPPMPDCFEAVFWVRGAYRSLGLGRAAMETVIPPKPGANAESPEGRRRFLYELIRDELWQRWGGHGAVRVLARYPVLGPASGDRLQRALWVNFLHDYEFRRARGRAPKADDYFVTLEYVIDNQNRERDRFVDTYEAKLGRPTRPRASGTTAR